MPPLKFLSFDCKTPERLKGTSSCAILGGKRCTGFAKWPFYLFRENCWQQLFISEVWCKTQVQNSMYCISGFPNDRVVFQCEWRFVCVAIFRKRQGRASPRPQNVILNGSLLRQKIHWFPDSEVEKHLPVKHGYQWALSSKSTCHFCKADKVKPLMAGKRVMKIWSRLVIDQLDKVAGFTGKRVNSTMLILKASIHDLIVVNWKEEVIVESEHEDGPSDAH